MAPDSSADSPDLSLVFGGGEGQRLAELLDAELCNRLPSFGGREKRRELPRTLAIHMRMLRAIDDDHGLVVPEEEVSLGEDHWPQFGSLRQIRAPVGQDVTVLFVGNPEGLDGDASEDRPQRLKGQISSISRPIDHLGDGHAPDFSQCRNSALRLGDAIVDQSLHARTDGSRQNLRIVRACASRISVS